MKYSIVFFFFLLFINSSLIACPTCVAKVEPNSPPFFTDEFYIPTNEQFETDLMITLT